MAFMKALTSGYVALFLFLIAGPLSSHALGRIKIVLQTPQTVHVLDLHVVITRYSERQQQLQTYTVHYCFSLLQRRRGDEGDVTQWKMKPSSGDL